MAGREPGPVGAALDDRDTWCGLIVDGITCRHAALRVAIAARGTERIMLVTDAMPVTGTDLAASSCMAGRSTARTAGSPRRTERSPAPISTWQAPCATAWSAWASPLPDALRMASLIPAEFLGLDDELGRIAPGYRANLVLLDDRLQVRQTWIGGNSN